MRDKRKLKRRHLIFYLRLIDNQTRQVLGYLVDITTEGLMMMAEQPVPVGKMFSLKLMASPSRYLSFNAKCKWCKKSVNPLLYDAGFELEGISLNKFNWIKTIVAEIGFND